MPPVPTSDVEIIRSFPRYQGQAEAGFIIDFLGTRTRTDYIRGLPPEGGEVEDYPLQLGNFHATTLEWAGALRAVLDAGSEFVAVELGAGWGPWLVSMTAAARLRGIQRVRLVGVEGSHDHVAFMHTHFRDNGLDPSQHTLLHGVVGLRDGTAEFPVLADPAAVWGARAIYPGQWVKHWKRRVRSVVSGVLGRWSPLAPPGPIERVPCYSLETLLAPFTSVDLVHVDIQGDEERLLPAAHRVLAAKVRWLVVGTHGPAIETSLRRRLIGYGWTLVAEEPCVLEGSARILTRDGCQVWRNPQAAGQNRVAA